MEEQILAFVELMGGRGNEELLRHLRYFSAAVYTQTSDVETEVNGLMTYDRKVIKVDEKRIREINLEICNSLK